MGYACDNGDGNAAAVLVTILEAGDVQAICGACFPGWVRAAAQAMAEPADGEAGGTPDGPAEGSGPSGDPVDTPAAEDTATGPTDPDDEPIPYVPADAPTPAAL